METNTIIKGILVFVVTFGCFVLMKQASPPQPTQIVSYPGSTPTTTAQPDMVIAHQGSPYGKPYGYGTPSNDREETNSTEAVPLESAPSDVILLIGSWRQSIVANNSQLEASYYAPVVKSYYGRTDVDVTVVEADKQAFIDRGNQVTGLSLNDVSVQEISPDSLRINLIKNVVWHSPKGEVHRLIRSTLNLDRTSDGWKITGERDGPH